MPSTESVSCFYCSEYAKIAKDYPINPASNDEKSFTPRCTLHWKYQCSKCGELRHFNGIAWCPDCKTFTCLGCVDEKMVRKEFQIYDYYYNIPCEKCGNFNPALDFAEYDGIHPVQSGDIQPGEDIVVWTPTSKDEIKSKEFPQKAWGLQRVLSLGKHPKFERLESLSEYTPKSTWDAGAPTWVSFYGEGGDYHHQYKILPEVYRMLDAQNTEKILDVACGEGNVARNLTKSGAKVTGIDISKMIDYAIEREEKENLGIRYLKMNAEKISDEFEAASFDKVVCNMALMDIEDYKTTIQQISLVLKENGIFVFSILHPAFAWPACTTLKIPEDSQRNEDKIRVVMDYFDERPTLFFWLGTAMLYFPRSLSSYINELVKNNLVLGEMSEPKASDELVQKFPRHAYLDDDIKPDFLIVKTTKKSAV
jgi:2-polyprenyl-3-methyl-5-hydroxy-6-metoxy-1,4-benzoquinol methylase